MQSRKKEQGNACGQVFLSTAIAAEGKEDRHTEQNPQNRQGQKQYLAYRGSRIPFPSRSPFTWVDDRMQGMNIRCHSIMVKRPAQETWKEEQRRVRHVCEDV